jgi:anti-sigma factor RsiW
MSIVDLHPEELLDRYAHGALSEADLARLHAHVATCAVCRFELAARGDFAEEAAAVLGAPDGVAPQPAETMPGPRPADRAEEAPVQPPARAVARPRRRAWIAGLAAALIGGMSFAALSTGVLRSFERAPAGAHGPPRGHVTRAASAAPATEVEATPAATPVAPAAPAQPESAAQVGASPESASNRAARVVHAPTAAELFRTANAARRAHEPSRSIASSSHATRAPRKPAYRTRLWEA